MVSRHHVLLVHTRPPWDRRRVYLALLDLSVLLDLCPSVFVPIRPTQMLGHLFVLIVWLGHTVAVARGHSVISVHTNQVLRNCHVYRATLGISVAPPVLLARPSVLVTPHLLLVPVFAVLALPDPTVVGALLLSVQPELTNHLLGRQVASHVQLEATVVAVVLLQQFVQMD